MKAPDWQRLLAQYSQQRRRHRYAGIAGSAALVIVLAYVFVFADQRDQRTALWATLDRAAEQQAEKQAVVAHTHSYGEKLHALESELRAAHVILPDDAEVPQFLAQLGTLAHDVGLAIERFEPKPERLYDYYAELGFHLQVRGNFHQIVAFLAQVGAMERIVNVSNVTMEVGKDAASSSGRTSVDGAFDVQTYRLLTDAQAEAAKAAKAAGDAAPGEKGKGAP